MTGSERSVLEPIHATLHFSQTVPEALAVAWSGLADPRAREVWCPPPDEAQVYDQVGFRVGGRDLYRCGAPESLDFHGVVDYVAIEPQQMIVHTDIVSAGPDTLAAALLTWTFEAVDQGTRIHVTDQVTSFVGESMIDGHRNGHTTALKQLADYVGSRSS